MVDTLTNVINTIFAGIRIRDIIDILIVAFAVYNILGFIRETRVGQLVKGLLFIVVATVVSGYLNLYTVHFILKNAMTIGVVAIIVVLQPELRRGLEHLGRSKFLSKQFISMEREEAKSMVSAIGEAIDNFSVNRVGALIVFERRNPLNDIIETGTIVDADMTTTLLENIFFEGAPLHDGAVIVRDDRIYAAACVLPLTTQKDLDKSLGTRHRAGIGITEKSDAITLIVSEETGVISLAANGELTRFLDRKSVEKYLFSVFWNDIETEDSLMPFLNFLRRRKDDDK